VLGFDPRLQFLHERDALDVLEHATVTEASGTFNVAGDGILMLSQAVRRLGRPTVPMPAFAVPSFGALIRQARRADLSPEQVAFLTFGRGLDTTRMRALLGFEPTYSTAEAFADFATSVNPGPWGPERVRATERAVLGALTAGGDRRG
jgi:UDP-glucose 4-epimerase